MGAGASSVEGVRAALLAAGHRDSIAACPAGMRRTAAAAAAIGFGVLRSRARCGSARASGPVRAPASGTVRVDEARLSGVLCRPVGRAEGRPVGEATGFASGGVAAMGQLTPPLAVVDEELFALDPPWAAAGSPAHVLRTDAEALRRLTGGVVAAVARP